MKKQQVELVVCYAFHNILRLKLESALRVSIEISLNFCGFMLFLSNLWIVSQKLRDASAKAVQWYFFNKFSQPNFLLIQNQNQKFLSLRNTSVIVNFHLAKNNFVFFLKFQFWPLMNLILIYLMVKSSIFKNSCAESQEDHYYYFIFYLPFCSFEEPTPYCTGSSFENH